MSGAVPQRERVLRVLAFAYVLGLFSLLVAYSSPPGACAVLFLMTPRKRARAPKVRDRPRGPPEPAVTPCRHTTMTADDDTPNEGQERTDLRTQSTPMLDASDEKIALELEGRKQDVRESADRVSKALLNEEVPLTDEKLGEMRKASEEIEALWRTLVRRVPEEHRFEEE